MKLLFVSKLSRFARAVNTIKGYVQAGEALGHQVALFGEKSSEFSWAPHSVDVGGFDFAIFIVYEAWDFPGLPYIARLLDGMPKERRVIIDCYGRYNETIRVEHDFNHLEKMDGHQGWEWVEAFQSVSEKILQPTLKPLREDVRPFLFHAYDPGAVARAYGSPSEAAQAWSGADGGRKPYGLAYAGNNWQRWTQIRPLLEAIEPLRETLGAICLAGADWAKRPDWDVKLGLHGADVDPELLRRLKVEVKDQIPFDEVVKFTSQARFCPIIHRPLFNRLGLLTNRTFETFCADTIPLLMLPDDLVEAVYGAEARLLRPGDDVPGRLTDMMRHPEAYWHAVLKTRAHLSKRHSYKQRFTELLAILEDRPVARP